MPTKISSLAKPPKIMVAILALAMAIFLLPVGVVAAFTGGGTGTAGDPYRITSCAELQEIQDELTAHYILMNDIDCSATSGWNGGQGFEPIGPSNATLDGQGFVINDLVVNRGNSSNIGLFGTMNSGAQVYDLGLEDVSINGSSNVGGLVGRNGGGSVENVFVTGSVDGRSSDIGGLIGINWGPVTRSYSTADVTGDDRVGGLIGETLGGNSISESFATGNVTENDRFQDGVNIGGLVGVLRGPLSNSYATGNVNAGESNGIGGLVGWDEDGTIINSYSTGEVTFNIDTDGTVGGLIGRSTSVAPENSFWNLDTSGQPASAGGEGKTTAEMKDITTFSAATWDIEVTNDHNLNNGYPFLTWQAGDSSPVWYIFEPSSPDGIPDCTENFVDCFVNPVTGTNVVLEVDDDCTINAAEMKPETDLNIADPGFEYPVGLMDFVLDCGTPGYTTTIKQYYFDTTNDGYVLRKHNPNTEAYFTIEGAAIEQTTLGGQTVTIATFQATDGGELDIDASADGTIIDPAGLAFSPDDSLADTGQSILPWITGALTAITAATGLFIYARRRQTAEL